MPNMAGCPTDRRRSHRHGCRVNAIAVLGWLGAAVSSLMIAPQAVRVVRLARRGESVSGVSRLSLALVVANATIWFAWAAGSGAWPAAVPGLINLPASGLALWYLRPTRTAGSVSLLCPCGSGLEAPHDLFVTNPAGYGSIVRCTGTLRLGVVPIPSDPTERAAAC